MFYLGPKVPTTRPPSDLKTASSTSWKCWTHSAPTLPPSLNTSKHWLRRIARLQTLTACSANLAQMLRVSRMQNHTIAQSRLSYTRPLRMTYTHDRCVRQGEEIAGWRRRSDAAGRGQPSVSAMTPATINAAAAMRCFMSPSLSRRTPRKAATIIDSSRAGATCETGASCSAVSTRM